MNWFTNVPNLVSTSVQTEYDFNERVSAAFENPKRNQLCCRSGCGRAVLIVCQIKRFGWPITSLVEITWANWERRPNQGRPFTVWRRITRLLVSRMIVSATTYKTARLGEKTN